MVLDEVRKEDEDAVTTLKSLIKAKEDDESAIIKAKRRAGNEDEDEEDKDEEDKDEYNETYMKKNMNTFMKKNPNYMKKMGYMKKAVDDAYNVANNDGDLNAEVTMVDGTEIFKAFRDMGAELLKAYQTLNENIENLEQQVEYSNSVLAATGEVLLKANETLEQISGTPNPVKGQLMGNNNDLQKAREDNVNDNQSNALLQKAQNVGSIQAKKLLFKAATEQGNKEAGKVLTQIESCFGNLNLLPANSLKLIADLAQE